LAYVICKKCGARINLIVNCRIYAPLLFSATCTNCKAREVYSYTDIVESEEERNRCEEESRVMRELLSIPSIFISRSIIVNLMKYLTGR
jgi:hypothetical protein